MTLSQWSLSSRIGLWMAGCSFLVVVVNVSVLTWASSKRAEVDISQNLEQARSALEGMLSNQRERAADKAQLLAQSSEAPSRWQDANALEARRKSLGLHFLARVGAAGDLSLASPPLPLGVSLPRVDPLRGGVFVLDNQVFVLAVAPAKGPQTGGESWVAGYRVDSSLLYEHARRSGVESVLRVKGMPLGESITSQSWKDVLPDLRSLSAGPGRMGSAEVRVAIQPLGPDVEWLLIRSFDAELARSAPVKRWLGLVGVLMAAALGCAAFSAVNGLTQSLATLTSAVTTALETENLAHPIPLTSAKEVGMLAEVFRRMLERLNDTWLQLRTAGARMGRTTDKVLKTSDHYRTGVMAQESALMSTSSSTGELARSARQIAENAGRVTQIAEETLQAARAAMEGSSSFIQSIQQMSDDNRKVALTVSELHRHVQQIGKIVEFINGVADKSELLALNAELEGEKAGQLGTGFSLVATEMRRLAENVLRSTREIESAMDGVREAAGHAVKATDFGVRRSLEGVATAQHVTSSLAHIVSLADRNAEAARSISAATLEQQSGATRLAESMVDALRVTQDSFRNSEEVHSAHRTLLELAEEVKVTVDRFHR